MGLIYTGSGLMIWHDLHFGSTAAKMVFMINLGVALEWFIENMETRIIPYLNYYFNNPFCSY